MPEFRGLHRSATTVAILCLLFALSGCEDDPEIHDADTPALAGDVQFEFQDHELRYLELTDENGETLEYPDPVLAIELQITNVGEDDYVYDPPHDARQMSEADTPMLYDYQAPDDPEAMEWEEFSPDPIPGVELQEGDWERQIDQSRTLGPEESLTDYLLFEPPTDDQRPLLLSIPPVMHRGETPTFIQFDYTAPEPVGRAVYGIGDTLEFDGVEFTVTDITQEYLELEEDGEEGFSNEPVLRLDYTIENTTDESIDYNPDHDDLTGRDGPLIRSGDIDFARVRFPGDTAPVDQKTETEIEAEESIEDYAVFERPSRATESATFVLSASHFDRTGTVRVDFSFEPEDVEEPEELED